jgi:NAD(P)-dependent dehydrogenase (short-subunit alcohol dehydrogenase family)
LKRVALVTGCGKRNGIGAAIARALSEDGFALVVTDVEASGVRDTHEPASTLDAGWSGVDSLVAELTGLGAAAISVTGDISVEADAARMVAAATSKFGRLDVLVNNAGAPFSMAHGDIAAIDPGEWDRAYAINVRGTFLMCRAAAPIMRAQKWGRIVNIASVAGRTGSKGNSAYASSKAAVIALTQSLALDLGAANVTANAILPGFILTTRSLTGMSKRLGKAEIDDATIAATVPSVPLGRAGTPEDVAGTVRFLASDQATYTSGQSFVIDGGHLRL